MSTMAAVASLSSVTALSFGNTS